MRPLAKDQEPVLRRVGLVARSQESAVEWQDVPDGETVRARLGVLLRFCASFHYHFFPSLEKINSGAAKPRAFPWFVEAFRANKVVLDQTLMGRLGQLDAYCSAFLLWFAGMHFSPAGLLHLMDPNVVATRSSQPGVGAELLPEFKHPDFAGLRSEERRVGKFCRYGW